MKVSVIFGTRPEAIKLAPVIIELRKRKDIICNVCVTAQHRQMLDQVLELFNIMPDEDLNLMTDGQSLAEFTSRAIEAIDKYLQKEKPDIILAQGDTTTVFCASLAAFYHKIPFGHVEAGLRTGNIFSPWPEEANRILTSRLATYHFAPTEINKQNLINEGVKESNIFITGNTIIDSLKIALKKIKMALPKIEGLPGDSIEFIGNKKYILITGHRRENFGEGLENICEAIIELSNKFPDLHFIYPVHLNPTVRETVIKILSSKKTNITIDRIHLIPPQDYLAFIYLMKNAYIILTDSGGVQEEAPSLGKPVFVLRDSTERLEGVVSGTAKLIGTKKNNIVEEISSFISKDVNYKFIIQHKNPYGDGYASRRIVKIITEIFKI